MDESKTVLLHGDEIDEILQFMVISTGKDFSHIFTILLKFFVIPWITN